MISLSFFGDLNHKILGVTPSNKRERGSSRFPNGGGNATRLSLFAV